MRPKTQFPKLKLGKKGQIPIVSDVLHIILQVMPTPLKFLIFIVLITIIAGFIVPTLLSFFGYDCAQDNGVMKLYQIPIQNIITKSVFISFPDALAALGGAKLPQAYELPDSAFPNGNKNYIRIPSDCFSTIPNTTINGTNYIAGYTALCTDCSYATSYSYGTRWWVLRKDGICAQSNETLFGYQSGDGYRNDFLITNPAGDVGVKNFCLRCAPPVGYYFNYSNCAIGETTDLCYFTLINESLNPWTTTDYIEQEYISRIKALGAVERAQDSTQFVNLQCPARRRPEIYFFGFRIMDTTLWIYISIGYVLFLFAYFWYGMLGVNR